MDGWTDRWTEGQMDGQMDGWRENLPILQDFVPYWGCCPAAAQLQPKNCIKRGKGTADHMMPLGNWLSPELAQEAPRRPISTCNFKYLKIRVTCEQA